MRYNHETSTNIIMTILMVVLIFNLIRTTNRYLYPEYYIQQKIDNTEDKLIRLKMELWTVEMLKEVDEFRNKIVCNIE